MKGAVPPQNTSRRIARKLDLVPSGHTTRLARFPLFIKTKKKNTKGLYYVLLMLIVGTSKNRFLTMTTKKNGFFLERAYKGNISFLIKYPCNPGVPEQGYFFHNVLHTRY
jgi:hypothetical protein